MTERKFPDSFNPTPEQIYSCKMVGGIAPDGNRYPKPKIIKKEHEKEDKSGTWWSWGITIFAKEVKDVDGKPETDDHTLGEYTFWVPEEVREVVDNLFNEGIYKFYLRKKAIWYKDKKGKDKTKSLYQVSAGLSDIKDVQEKMLDVEPIPKPKPKPVPQEQEPEPLPIPIIPQTTATIPSFTSMENLLKKIINRTIDTNTILRQMLFILQEERK